MDFHSFHELNDWSGLMLAVILIYMMSLWKKFAALKHQLDQLEASEIDRAYFSKLRDEKLASMEADLCETKDLLKDLVDFQKADGRYKYDPDDPRLPAHIRDQTGREY